MDWENDTMGAIAAPASDGVALRAMATDDLAAAHALTAELRWPHRPADWEQAFRHGEGLVAERDGQIVGTGLRWRWGPVTRRSGSSSSHRPAKEGASAIA